MLVLSKLDLYVQKHLAGVRLAFSFATIRINQWLSVRIYKDYKILPRYRFMQPPLPIRLRGTGKLGLRQQVGGL